MVEPIIFGQYNGQKIELGVKVHLDQLGIHGGPPGASKIKTGFAREKMNDMEWNS